MKTLFYFIGIFVGLILGSMIGKAVPLLGGIAFFGCIYLGYYIGKSIEESNEEAERQRREAEKLYRAAEYEHRQKERKRNEVIELARNYPEATKQYFKIHWGITKPFINDSDITDERVDTLFTHRYSYESDEKIYNATYKAIKEAQEAQRREAERREAEKIRREKELALQRKEQEKLNLINSLPACVISWNSHSNSSLKHKYFYDYYPYGMYKDNASSYMWEAWKTVWNFKNDPTKFISSSDHSSALNNVIAKVENTLRSTFGSKTEYLTFVCLTASTQRKTELRFKEFANKVCTNLNMTNAYDYIKVSGDGSAKHEGGTGVGEKSYFSSFFRDKYVVLFDDVRTTGNSIERERRTLESFGAKVLCVITIAQTTH